MPSEQSLAEPPTFITNLRSRLDITPRTTATWITLLQQGDEQAWNDVLYLCLDTCRKKLRKLPQTAQEDAASDVVLAIFDRIKKPKPFPHQFFEFYIISACNNKCADIARQSAEVLVVQDSEHIEQTVPATPVAHMLHGAGVQLDELAWALLLACVERLPPEKRAMAHDYFYGKGPKEIAQSMGPDVPENRISKQLFDTWRKVNRFLDGCVTQLTPTDQLLFHLYLDRSKRGQRKRLQTSAVESPTRVRTTQWIVQQLAQLKAADQTDATRLAVLEETLGTPLSAVDLPAALTIDWVVGQLQQLLLRLRACVGGEANP